MSQFLVFFDVYKSVSAFFHDFEENGWANGGGTTSYGSQVSFLSELGLVHPFCSVKWQVLAKR